MRIDIEDLGVRIGGVSFGKTVWMSGSLWLVCRSGCCRMPVPTAEVAVVNLHDGALIATSADTKVKVITTKVVRDEPNDTDDTDDWAGLDPPPAKPLR
jgi:hypothetical protein